MAEDERNYNLYWIHLNSHDLFNGGYVGISKSVKKRWANHRSSKENIKLRRALDKHKDKVIFEVIASGLSEQEAKDYEVLLRPVPQIGWNIEAGGGNPPVLCGADNGFYGRKHTDDTKLVIAQKQSERIQSEAEKAKRRNSLTGQKRKKYLLPNGLVRPMNIIVRCYSEFINEAIEVS